MRFRKCIHIEGRCLEDVFSLPCVLGVFKDASGRVFYRLTLGTKSDWSVAEKGDYLCEDYEGCWHRLTESEYNKFYSDGDNQVNDQTEHP